MARYSGFKYDAGVKYGTSAQTTYSVEPFDVLALNYTQALVTWSQPASETGKVYSRFRIVRNQLNVPETQEDGIILIDEVGPFALKTRYIVDGTAPVNASDTIGKDVYYNNGTRYATYANPSVGLQQGKLAYYAVWLLKTETIDAVPTTYWDIVASSATIIAQDHSTLLGNTDDTPESPVAYRTRTRSTHEKIMDLLPKVFTSRDQNSLDVVDETSDLYNFLYGFSYSIDEIMTMADMLLPNHTGELLTKDLLNVRSYELGLKPDNKDSTKYQRQLVREARYIYGRKGTQDSLKTLVEAMTGFNAELSLSPNLFLTNQDSSFRGGVGFWKTIGDCTITALKSFTGPQLDDFPTDLAEALDFGYVGKVVVNAAGARITNGTFAPKKAGIPISAGTTYTFSGYTQSSNVTSTVPTIIWYDYLGVEIAGERDVLSTVTLSSSWAKFSSAVTAPIGATYVGFELSFSDSGTVYLDMLQFSPVLGTITGISNSGGYVTYTAQNTLVPGQLVTITGVSPSGYNVVGAKVVRVGKTASSDTVNSSFTIINATTTSYSSGGVVDAPFSEARGVTVHLSPSKVNFIHNPSFESDTSGWTATDDVLDTAIPVGLAAGVKSMAATLSSTKPISTSSVIGELTPGSYYTFSIYVKSATGTVPAEISVAVTDNAAGSTATTADTETVSITTTWSRHQVNVYIPDEYSLPTIECALTGTAAGDATVYVDAAQLERAYSATDYFDGSMDIEGAEWEGADNSSISYMFPNKDARLARLYTDISQFIPMNTPYFVKSPSAVEVVAGVPIADFA